MGRKKMMLGAGVVISILLEGRQRIILGITPLLVTAVKEAMRISLWQELRSTERGPQIYNVHSWLFLFVGYFFYMEPKKKKWQKKKNAIGKHCYFSQLVANRKIWLFLADFFYFYFFIANYGHCIGVGALFTFPLLVLSIFSLLGEGGLLTF